ncbi:DUF1295 domain-containing protein [Shimia sp. NS0008-38b]|uniref:methyltransferase family protein n=1 Tax=Shimia sp. NS0008-38b TaxID=3127653 RepID=UPI00310A41CC
MSQAHSKSGGVDRRHAASFGPKLIFAGLHAGLVAVCFWLAFGGFDWPDGARAKLLAVCAMIYFFRHLITLFILLKRRVELFEALGLTGFIAVFEIGFLLLGAGFLSGEEKAFGPLDGVGFLLLVTGSYLNSGSEFQRMVWKRRAESKGKCFTGGLFAYSVHINYFGDVLLFTGWAILTSSVFAFAVPLFMAVSFVFFHIPSLDAYLAQRYGEDFKRYAAKTAKLVPFLY